VVTFYGLCSNKMAAELNLLLYLVVGSVVIVSEPRKICNATSHKQTYVWSMKYCFEQALQELEVCTIWHRAIFFQRLIQHFIWHISESRSENKFLWLFRTSVCCDNVRGIRRRVFMFYSQRWNKILEYTNLKKMAMWKRLWQDGW
jgi:hypothetical protein